jgi:hypothetical protein
MEVLSAPHGGSLGTSWRFSRHLMEVLSAPHGGLLGTSWRFSRHLMEVLSAPHGGSSLAERRSDEDTR